MLASKDKAKLLQSIHALGLPEFRASDIITTLRPALKDYLQGRDPTPIKLGLALKTLIGQKHGGLKLQGLYDKERRMWRYRVVSEDYKEPPKPVPPPFADHRRKPPEVPKPMLVQVQERAESVRVNSDGKIQRETYGPHDYRGTSIPDEVRQGVWTKNNDGTYTKLGERWLDRVAQTGYPGGLADADALCTEAVRMAGGSGASGFIDTRDRVTERRGIVGKWYPFQADEAAYSTGPRAPSMIICDAVTGLPTGKVI
jgi:hypothetical protein